MNNLSISAITKKMTKFQNILIASDSDSDDNDNDKLNHVSLDINDTNKQIESVIDNVINDISENIVDTTTDITMDVSNNITTDVSNNNLPKKKIIIS